MTKLKPQVAFFDFTGCEGCQLTVIDSLQLCPELLDVVEIIRFREASSELGDEFHVAFIEGSCTRTSDEHHLQKIREQAQIVIALGACAHLGGVNAMRNWHPQTELIRQVYGSNNKRFENYPAKPISEIIQIDGFIPGCPIDRVEFIRAVRLLLQGRRISIPDEPICVECKLHENDCLLIQGKLCMGPIIRRGCNAICPTNNMGCEGCRGLISNPNLKWFEYSLNQFDIDKDEFSVKKKLFLSYQLMER